MTDETITYDGANWQAVMSWAHEHGRKWAERNSRGDLMITLHMPDESLVEVPVGASLWSPAPGTIAVTP